MITSITYAQSAPWVGVDLSGKTCQGRGQGYGPYDYTSPEHRKKKLPIVTVAHFTRNVETLKKGEQSASPEGDLDYTLRAFPNHHRALYAMMRYQLKTQANTYSKAVHAECYFLRAMNFKPDDYRVMQIYANYLIKKNHPKMAIGIYKRALEIKKAPIDINYSLGLLYYDLKEFDKAVEQAKIAYAGGIKKSKLAKKLKKIDRWPVN